MSIRSLPFTVAEYFAGIGLVRMGLQPLGWQVIWANDISVKKYEMYKTFFSASHSHYIVGDIFKINPTTIPPTILATCSFPCIDLSLAGNMNGLKGEHSSAFWGFVKILKSQGTTAPPIILVENVPGWLNSNGGADFRVTIQALNNLGYSCDVFTLNAQRFTPQSRLRVFLIGSKFQIFSKRLNLIFKRPTSLLTDRLRKSILVNQDLDWFYNDLPQPPPLQTHGLTAIIEEIKDFDNRWWDRKKVDRHLEMMEQSHFERVSQLIQNSGIAYRTFFRRRRKGLQCVEVRQDDLSGCLRTAVGGSGKQFLIKAGNGSIRMRAMTPREYARLQGVPDNFPIRTNGVQALTGFGDAVCVPAITWIAKYALNPLAENFFANRLILNK